MVKTIGPKSHWDTYLEFAWVNQVVSGDDSLWQLLYDPSTCRTYMSCYLFGSTIDEEYLEEEFGRNVLVDSPPEKEFTSIFVSASTEANSSYSLKNMVEQVEKKLPKLHKKEKFAGISLTKFIVSEYPAGRIGIIFIGDKVWHSNIWKSTMYTFYLKKLCLDCPFESPNSYGDMEKQRIFKPFEKKLLSKVNTEFEEEFTDHSYESVHERSGFITICEGIYNPHMTKLLLG